MLDGRPVAAGSFLWQARAGTVSRDCSRCRSNLCRLNAPTRIAWEPAQPGIKFTSVPDAPSPADTANKRLIQMQVVRGAFSSRSLKGPPFYEENSVYQFRLIRKPLLRYGDSETPGTGGSDLRVRPGDRSRGAADSRKSGARKRDRLGICPCADDRLVGEGLVSTSWRSGRSNASIRPPTPPGPTLWPVRFRTPGTDRRQPPRSFVSSLYMVKPAFR